MYNNPSTSFRITDRLALFPDSTRDSKTTRFSSRDRILPLSRRAMEPRYIFTTAPRWRPQWRSYRIRPTKALLRAFRITYAGKAFLCKAIAEWTQTHDLFVDCTGEGEIAMAVAGGVRRRNILVHGVNKSPADIKTAIEQAGTIVVDNLTELKNISNDFSRCKSSDCTCPDGQRQESRSLPFTNLWLRLLPGCCGANSSLAHANGSA